MFLDPIDAMQSRVKDVKTDITNKGAFTFSVVVKDRYKNSIRVIDKDNKTQAKISVQYTSQDFPQSMKFLDCSKTLKIGGAGDQYELRCAGADNERIHFYPSINNVPLGGQAKYEARTTLCPGKSSCEGKILNVIDVLVTIVITASYRLSHDEFTWNVVISTYILDS